MLMPYMTCQLVGRAFTKPARASTWAGVIGVRLDSPPQQVVSTLFPPMRSTAGAIWAKVLMSETLLETKRWAVSCDFS